MHYSQNEVLLLKGTYRDNRESTYWKILLRKSEVFTSVIVAKIIDDADCIGENLKSHQQKFIFLTEQKGALVFFPHPCAFKEMNKHTPYLPVM